MPSPPPLTECFLRNPACCGLQGGRSVRAQVLQHLQGRRPCICVHSLTHASSAHPNNPRLHTPGYTQPNPNLFTHGAACLHSTGAARPHKDVLGVPPIDLVELVGVSSTDVQAVVASAARAVAPTPISVSILRYPPPSPLASRQPLYNRCTTKFPVPSALRAERAPFRRAAGGPVAVSRHRRPGVTAVSTDLARAARHEPAGRAAQGHDHRGCGAVGLRQDPVLYHDGGPGGAPCRMRGHGQAGALYRHRGRVLCREVRVCPPPADTTSRPGDLRASQELARSDLATSNPTRSSSNPRNPPQI